MSQIDLRKDSEKHNKKQGHKQKRDVKLQELEKQLEFAESRCGTLKQQLDYIKMLYGCRKDIYVEEKKLPKEGGNGDGYAVNQLEHNEIMKWNNQDEKYINKEDGDGPELVKQTASYSNTTTTNSSNNKTFVQEKREVKRKSPKQKVNLKLLKTKKKSNKKVKKRRKIDDEESSKVSNASSQTHGLMLQDPLVEIYKNSALNVESESGLEIFGKNKQYIINEGLRQITNKHSDNKQEEEDKEIRAKSYNCLGPKKESTCLKEEERQFDLPPDFNFLLSQRKQNDLGEFLNKENIPKPDSAYIEPLKGYCQPTISSKKKQVERDIYSNLNNLNVKNIPFIAARSTAPSHNINVNIQQVLSIIKKRKPLTENITNVSECTNPENAIFSLLSLKKSGSKTTETVSAPATEISSSWESKNKSELPRTNLSYWMSNSEINKEKPTAAGTTVKPNNEVNPDWSLKVEKLKKVLVFLHQDFTSLSQKYKRLQKKLKKRNITKTDAKDELAGIERNLEKKEEEITVVIALYKEVLHLKEELKKLQEKYNSVTSGKSFMMDGLWQSKSAHTQMTSLLRKIQSFQDKLKG